MDEKNIPLPCPRLQLRWEVVPPEKVKGGWDLACYYELVIPPGCESDLRLKKGATELVINMHGRGPGTRSSTGPPGRWNRDHLPFREGAHAFWDRAHLGNLPVYVIDPDGVAHLRENR